MLKVSNHVLLNIGIISVLALRLSSFDSPKFLKTKQDVNLLKSPNHPYHPNLSSYTAKQKSIMKHLSQYKNQTSKLTTLTTPKTLQGRNQLKNRPIFRPLPPNNINTSQVPKPKTVVSTLPYDITDNHIEQLAEMSPSIYTIKMEDLKAEISELKGLTVGLANLQTKKILQLARDSQKMADLSEEANNYLNVQDAHEENEFSFDGTSEVEKMSNELLVDALEHDTISKGSLYANQGDKVAHESSNDEHMEMILMDNLSQNNYFGEDDEGHQSTSYNDADNSVDTDDIESDKDSRFLEDTHDNGEDESVSYADPIFARWRNKRSPTNISRDKLQERVNKRAIARKAKALRALNIKRRRAEEKKRLAVERTRKLTLARHARRLKSLKSPCERKAVHSEFLRKMALQRIGELNTQVRSLKNQFKRLVAIRKREMRLRQIQVKKQVALRRLQQKRLTANRKAQAAAQAKKRKSIKVAQQRVKKLRAKRSIQNQLKVRNQVLSSKPKVKRIVKKEKVQKQPSKAIKN